MSWVVILTRSNRPATRVYGEALAVIGQLSTNKDGDINTTAKTTTLLVCNLGISRDVGMRGKIDTRTFEPSAYRIWPAGLSSFVSIVYGPPSTGVPGQIELDDMPPTRLRISNTPTNPLSSCPPQCLAGVPSSASSTALCRSNFEMLGSYGRVICTRETRATCFDPDLVLLL